ncbi:MAG: hypothetical protein ACO3OM_07375 [Alphaproteobacteria bacterium]
MMEIKIVIGGTPVQQYADDDSCPIEIGNTDMNMENKLQATEEYNYGPPTDADVVCGNCAAFNMTSRILDCISKVVTDSELGYCESHRFMCSSKKTCDSWVEGGPITDEKLDTRGDVL